MTTFSDGSRIFVLPGMRTALSLGLRAVLPCGAQPQGVDYSADGRTPIATLPASATECAVAESAACWQATDMSIGASAVWASADGVSPDGPGIAPPEA